MESSGNRTISVTAPVSKALDWMQHVAFATFDLGKWFTLGFCAWLAWIGQGGAPSFTSNWELPRDRVGDSGFEQTTDWVHAHLAAVLALAVVLVLLVVGLILLLTWLSSRGKFMFLDGLIHNRGAVVEPWNRFRGQANRLFVFRIIVGLFATGIFFLLMLILAAGVWGLGESSPIAIGLLVLWVGIIVVVAIVFALIGVAINDFVVPIMWLRDNRPLEAWNEFMVLLQRHSGTFVAYALMKILLGLGIAVFACLITCVTCCIAIIPYLGTVILLPLFIFRRSYSMFFLSQFHPDYAPFAPAIPMLSAPVPSAAPASVAPDGADGPGAPEALEPPEATPGSETDAPDRPETNPGTESDR